MFFWIVAAGLAAVVAGLLALAMLRGQTDALSASEYDLQVYRDQLKEVERDLARGVIGAAEAERLRTEVSRRILAADSARQSLEDHQRSPAAVRMVAVVVIGVLVFGGGLYGYWTLGSPGYGDLPRVARIAAADERHRNRPSQAQAEAALPARLPIVPPPDFTQLMLQLREVVKDRPDDLRGQMLLAQNEARLGNLKAAYAAQGEVIRIKGDAATAEDYTQLADLMIASAEGYVSPEAETALQAAMARDPEDPLARYYLGLMALQADRPDLAFRTWVRLLREGPADAPWMAPIRARIEEVAWLAGENFDMPPAPAPAEGLSGPSADDVEAAQEMSVEDRQAMIEGMVAQLSDRLATEGGTPQEWARLIMAYGVLGRTDEATAIWTEAQQVFADTPEALAPIRDAARQTGIAE